MPSSGVASPLTDIDRVRAAMEQEHDALQSDVKTGEEELARWKSLAASLAEEGKALHRAISDCRAKEHESLKETMGLRQRLAEFQREQQRVEDDIRATVCQAAARKKCFT